MLSTQRYLLPFVEEDLQKKMVFIGGPRQVGKTTLAKEVSQGQKSLYLNWDFVEDRQTILKARFPSSYKLILLDEIHKYRRWKNHIKGLYDTQKERLSFLVTGSARLDLYRRGGDSLQGRYHYYRLHPFSLAEMLHIQAVHKPFQELPFPSEPEKSGHLKTLLQYGGFPEPLSDQNEKTHRRWHFERVDRLIREDIREVESVRDLSGLEMLVHLLEEHGATRFSLNNMREQLQVNYRTAALWTNILERFYFHYRIYPYSRGKVKSLKKEPKLYLWDWSIITDPGRKFENLIASHLLKFCHFLQDTEGYRTNLWYLRDIEGREVDFLVTVNQKPWFSVEVKVSDTQLSPHLIYFKERMEIPQSFQVVLTPGIDVIEKGVRIMSADYFLQGLV